MGLSAKQAAAVVDNLREEASERRVRKLEEREIQVITYLDDAYPELLAQISDPPWVIYFKGIGSLCITRRLRLSAPG